MATEKITNNEKAILSQLLHEIKDASLQQILREIIFNGNGDIMSVIIKYRPDYSIEFNQPTRG